MPRRRRIVAFQPSPDGDSSVLAALAYFAGVLEREAHDFPLTYWADLLLVVNPGEYAQPPLAEVPTTELPGSAGKLAVMMGRVADGLSPFHPRDGIPAWREFIAEELDGRDSWGLAVETCGGRVLGVGAVCLQGRREAPVD